MNQPIRCEPLLFSAGTEKAAGEAPLCPKAKKSNFGELLEAELENPDEEKVERQPSPDKTTPEGWALAVPTQFPLIIQEPIPERSTDLDGIVANVEASKGLGFLVETNPNGDTSLSDSDEKHTDPGEIIPRPSQTAENAELEQHSIRGRDKPSGLQPAVKQGGGGVVERIGALAAIEQKLPSAKPAEAQAVAQISEKGAERAGFAGGMVAAQAPSMLLASPEAEEKAPHQGLSLLPGMELLESQLVPQALRGTQFNRVFSIRSETQSKVEIPEINFFTEPGVDQTQLETISETQELLPSRPVEPTSVAEAIRTHVQLLKISSQDRIEVILRPDSNTALLLKVENVNGQIQVQARCDRGDFALLEANWNSIQNTLATQGIRVEPLQMNGTNLQKDSSSGFDQPANHRQEREHNFTEQEVRNRKTARQSSASGIAVRGWQSWA